MTAISNWYKGLSNSSRAGLVTLFFSFVGTIILQVLGLLSDIQDWLNNGGPEPKLDAFGKVVLSAIVATTIGFINWLVRYIQEKRNPASVPQYPQ